MKEQNDVVVDASAVIELLLRTATGDKIRTALAGQVAHAPAHLDAEVLSALGRLNRAGELDDDDVVTRLDRFQSLPVKRHAVPDLLHAAWDLRHNFRLADALYVALADRVAGPLVTTDAPLKAALERR